MSVQLCYAGTIWTILLLEAVLLVSPASLVITNRRAAQVVGAETSGGWGRAGSFDSPGSGDSQDNGVWSKRLFGSPFLRLLRKL